VGVVALVVVLAIVGSSTGNNSKSPGAAPASTAGATGSSTGDAVYLAEIQAILTDWSETLTNFTGVIAAAGDQTTLIFTSSWQASVLDALNEGKQYRSRITALKPSARLAATHEEILSALDAWDDVDRETRAAIDDINAGDLTSATAHLSSATQALNDMNSHITAAKNVLPTQ